jgi:hypothetical protein
MKKVTEFLVIFKSVTYCFNYGNKGYLLNYEIAETEEAGSIRVWDQSNKEIKKGTSLYSEIVDAFNKWEEKRGQNND